MTREDHAILSVAEGAPPVQILVNEWDMSLEKGAVGLYDPIHRWLKNYAACWVVPAARRTHVHDAPLPQTFDPYFESYFHSGCWKERWHIGGQSGFHRGSQQSQGLA